MSAKNIATALLGFGGLLIGFVFIVWPLNIPDYSNFSRAGEQARRMSSDPRQQQEMIECAQQNLTAYKSMYNQCLFRSLGAENLLCQPVAVVPYLNIGGILLLLSGAGLFVFGRQKRSA